MFDNDIPYYSLHSSFHPDYVTSSPPALPYEYPLPAPDAAYPGAFKETSEPLRKKQ